MNLLAAGGKIGRQSKTMGTNSRCCLNTLSSGDIRINIAEVEALKIKAREIELSDSTLFDVPHIQTQNVTATTRVTARELALNDQAGNEYVLHVSNGYLTLSHNGVDIATFEPS